MNIREKVLVYPYNEWFTPFLRHREMLENYDFSGLVSPNGWGFSGKDASLADGGDNIGIIVHSDFNGMLDLCDTVLFTKSSPTISENILMSKMELSIKKRKNIICCIGLDSNKKKHIQQLCEDSEVYFQHFDSQEKSVDLEVRSNSISMPDTPVIFVLGSGEKTNKFEIQLILRENFIKDGYKVSQIGSRDCCELLGFHSFPEFMVNSSMTETQKIVLFNQYVKAIEISENPDVIIIGIPGGVMPFNNEFTNRFGILAYEVSQAIMPDFAIFSTLFEDYSPDYFASLSTSLKFKLGFEVDCFNLSTTKFDWDNSKLQKEMLYITLDSEFINQKLQSYKFLNTPVFNLFDSQDRESMMNFIPEKLGCYGEIKVI